MLSNQIMNVSVKSRLLSCITWVIAKGYRWLHLSRAYHSYVTPSASGVTLFLLSSSCKMGHRFVFTIKHQKICVRLKGPRCLADVHTFKDKDPLETFQDLCL